MTTEAELETARRHCEGLARSLHAAVVERDSLRAEVVRLRAEIGEAWFADGCDMATALRRKTSMLQRLADGGAE